jgi:hypothetical protein
MSNILPFPHVNGAEASGCTVCGMSLADQCQNAWSNYYRYAVAGGTCREKARDLADGFVQYHYGSMIDELRTIMGADHG